MDIVLELFRTFTSEKTFNTRRFNYSLAANKVFSLVKVQNNFNAIP